MSAPDAIAGRWIPQDTPNWAPIRAVLGDDLTGRFMWMGAVELEDGQVLGLYKDFLTGRYLQLSSDGAAFCLVGHHRYRPIDLGSALRGVFEPREVARLVPEEEAALEEVIARADATIDIRVSGSGA